MIIASLLARLILAGVFVVSGVAKLRDRAGATQAVRDFGLPAALASLIGALLPVAELGTAAALLTGGRAAVWGALAAIVLLGSFTVGIAVNLLLGRHPDCHCFGQLSTKPLSWWSVLRNVALLAVTIPILRAGVAQAYAAGALRGRTAPQLTVGIALVLLTAAVVALGWLFVSLLGRYGAVLIRVETLEAQVRGEDTRAVATPFELLDVTGASTSLDDLLHDGRPALLFFTSANCGPCAALAPEIGGWAHTAQANVAVLGSGDPAAVREKFATSDAVLVLVDDIDVASRYGATATPAALVVAQDRRVAAGPAFGADEIRNLVAPFVPGAVGLELTARPIGEGDPTPAVELSDEDGHPVDPAAVAGDGVLVFWDPRCGFAERIKDDVVAWEHEQGANAALVLVTKGDPVEVRDSGLRSRLVLDPHFHAGNAYGAPGTPSAVAVRDGKLASPVAVGGPEVLGLLQSYRPAQRSSA